MKKIKDIYGDSVAGLRSDGMSFGDKCRADWYFSKLYEKIILIIIFMWAVISGLLLISGIMVFT